MLSLYVAGPMRGLPEFNFPAFFEAADLLRAMGHEVLNPAQVDADAGFQWEGLTGHEDLAGLGFNLREALATDLAWIAAHASGVAVLPGWEASKGARAEVALALALGLAVVTLRAGRLVELEVSMRPMTHKEMVLQ